MSLSIYSYLLQEEDNVIAAVFETKTGTKYRAYFYPTEEFDHDTANLIKTTGYYFGFTKLDEFADRKEPVDLRIRNTINRIIEEFFETVGSDKILIFVCDEGDGKHFKRNSLFDRWFCFLNSKRIYQKLDETIVQVTENENDGNSTNEITFISLVFYANNPSSIQIEKDFQELKEYLVFTKH